MSFADVAARLDGRYHFRHTFISVNGTGSPDPFGPGFSGDIGRALDPDRWFWQPIGYPAAVFPMGPSVDIGVNETVNQINRHPGTFALSGYSQGAVVVDKVWRDHIWSPAGDLHHRLGDVVAIINYGDPMRCPGIANGNLVAGMPAPKLLDGQVTGGIAGPDDLTAEQTPPFLLSFANDGDLYASAPVGADPWHNESAVGHDETLIYNLIQNLSFGSTFALAEELITLTAMPLATAIPLVEAIVNGLMFVGTGLGAHNIYDIGPALSYLAARATQIPARAA